MEKITIFESSKNGHRESYINYFDDIYNGNNELLFGLTYSNMWTLLRRNKVVFSTADDYFLIYFLFSLLRKILNKSSIGILIRAEYVLDSKSIKHRLKLLLLQIQLKYSLGESYTIMPFFVEPKLKTIVSNWIYDPAFFSRNLKSQIQENESEQEIINLIKLSNNKKIFLFLGALSKERGLLDFINLTEELKDEISNGKVILIAAGKNIYGFNQQLINELKEKGLYIFPSQISETIFDKLIDVSYALWCVFSKEYDQFSGIFCNGVKKSKIIFVRQDSRLNTFLKKIKFELNETNNYNINNNHCMYTTNNIKIKIFNQYNKSLLVNL